MADLSDEDAALLTEARSWRDQDPDEETREELNDLITTVERGAPAEARTALAGLHDRFDSRLAFGTAGLRGPLSAGPNRMNRVLVSQAARGLATYLLERVHVGDGDATGDAGDAGTTPRSDDRPSVVIGYDARRNSAVFARDTAEILAGAGIRAILLPRMLPTPVLAFAVRELHASAGVMVTASHNPARDNGYKVYLGGADGGSQIVPPADHEIARHILRAAQTPVPQMPRSRDYEVAGDEVVDAYVARAAAAAVRMAVGRALGEVRVVYTAMHGVGWQTARRVFSAAGIPAPALVLAQIDPDPAFPTVEFPNPEEPGAMDLAFARGREMHADLVIANDPDADRMAVAIPDAAAEGGYRRLGGNEVGMLLGWAIAEHVRQGDRRRTLAVSIVSSPGLRLIAERYGLGYTETLTGFKWISRVPGLVYGFEEALGYLIDPDAVRDKDGISAATAFIVLARRLAATDTTITDRLDRFAEEFGYHASRQVAIRVADLSRLRTLMTRLRSKPPTTIGNLTVTGIDDFADGFDSLPPSDVLRMNLADGARVVVRPSGTEPKLKIYLDAAALTGEAAARKAAAEARVDALADAMTALLDE
jgi:phosphomannomutase